MFMRQEKINIENPILACLNMNFKNMHSMLQQVNRLHHRDVILKSQQGQWLLKVAA